MDLCPCWTARPRTYCTVFLYCGHCHQQEDAPHSHSNVQSEAWAARRMWATQDQNLGECRWMQRLITTQKLKRCDLFRWLLNFFFLFCKKFSILTVNCYSEKAVSDYPTAWRFPIWSTQIGDRKGKKLIKRKLSFPQTKRKCCSLGDSTLCFS